MKRKCILGIVLVLLCSVNVFSATWRSYLAYNDVSGIAITPNKVYALSAGALFSVDIVSERITTYDSGSGLHSTNIHNIGYDPVTGQLLVVYETGKMDIMDSNGRMRYIVDFYNKDITATKTTNNITFHNGVAYLAEPFGVLSFSMSEQTFMHCCYIGAEATEVNVQDIVIQKDSIYAFADNLLYVAHLKDNILDYRNWHSGIDDGRVKRDTKKNTTGQDAYGDTWTAGGSKGVLRHSVTGFETSYLPDGPLNNMIYNMSCFGDKLYVVNGGADANQYLRPGCVMILQNNRWHNITTEQVKSQISYDPFLDCMNVVQDPANANHFFVTSYGTGLYEMNGESVLNHFLPDNSTLSAAAPLFPKKYTRCVGACLDSMGTLWAAVAGDQGAPIVYKKKSGEWGSLFPIIDESPYMTHSPLTLLLDNRNQQRKWLVTFRMGTGILLVDDGGTLEDITDDRAVFRSSWQNQLGDRITPSYIYAAYQDDKGNLWFGGENTGLLYIPHNVDFFTSDHCQQILTTDENGSPLLTEYTIHSITQDGEGQLWIASNAGVYVISQEGKIIEHYTVSNTMLSTNEILSLAYCATKDLMYVGSADGLYSYGNHSTGEEVNEESSSKEETESMGSMGQWTNYFSYRNVTHGEEAGQEVFALADGAIFSVDKTTEEVFTYSKITGLNGTNINHIAYDNKSGQLLIIYANNMIDFLQQGQTYLMSDLYLKSSSMSIQVNDVIMADGKAYLALSFGVMAIDMKKREVASTYYIGANAASVNVISLAMVGDSLYALSQDSIYYASKKDNMMDYANWKRLAKPRQDLSLKKAMSYNQTIHVLCQDSVVYCWNNGWKALDATMKFAWTRAYNGHLLGRLPQKGVFQWEQDQWNMVTNQIEATDAIYDAGSQVYWLTNNGKGLVRYQPTGYQVYCPQGPYTNMSFRVQAFGDKVFVAPGGRWANQESRAGDAIWMNYNQKTWSVCNVYSTYIDLGVSVRDLLYYAVDPTDDNHFYAASYGMGVVEYKDGKAVCQYNTNNSTLRSAVDPSLASANKYIRTDGVYMDASRNLWVLNTGTYAYPLNVMSPDGVWYGLNLKVNGAALKLNTPSYLIADQNNAQRKWFIEHRGDVGLILFDDGGTPYQSWDDQTMRRALFMDQNSKAVSPQVIYSMVQDKKGDLWVGYDEGLFIIPADVDFFTSNQCQRVIIPREDGTGLADYLLGTEQVKAIAVDGANRKWIGTAASGIYLVSEDGLEELAHFTVENSPLLSNEITSIAIHDYSGEVFIGTSKGLISYHADASEPREDFSNAYVYPNPVRPNYAGVITIIGLMDQTVVNILDAGGNLVCKTMSNGGTAIWDGKDQRGRRAAAGVYTILCNTADGSNHHAIKVLVL